MCVYAAAKGSWSHPLFLWVREVCVCLVLWPCALSRLLGFPWHFQHRCQRKRFSHQQCSNVAKVCPANIKEILKFSSGHILMSCKYQPGNRRVFLWFSADDCCSYQVCSYQVAVSILTTMNVVPYYDIFLRFLSRIPLLFSCFLD